MDLIDEEVRLTAGRCLDVLYCLLAATAPLHALPDRAQHQARDEEVARVEQWEEEHPEQAWPAAGSRAHDQPRHACCLLIKHEHPTELAVQPEPWIVAHRGRRHHEDMGRRVEGERSLWFKLGHREEGRVGRSVGNGITDRELLELRQDVVSARWALDPEEALIDPVVPAIGIPTGPVVAHLHQPGPYRGCGSVNSDGMRRFHHRVRHEIITRQGAVHFALGRAPALSLATQQVGG